MEGGENMMESVYYLDEMMRWKIRDIEKKTKNVWQWLDKKDETKKKKTSAATLAQKIDC
jgi:hypothetical protein